MGDCTFHEVKPVIGELNRRFYCVRLFSRYETVSVEAGSLYASFFFDVEYDASIAKCRKGHNSIKQTNFAQDFDHDSQLLQIHPVTWILYECFMTLITIRY